MSQSFLEWYDPMDQTAPVIQAGAHIQSKYPGMEMPTLPVKAVVFCLGKGMAVLEERFSVEPRMEKLPGFITHSKVDVVIGHPDVCFLHGGYGAPQAACTVETLHALGVQELLLVGLCGGFHPQLQVGDVVIPEKIWSEEGTSLHYRERLCFVELPTPRCEALAVHLTNAGFHTENLPTVTTDAVYRQTYQKEALWREQGCVGVDMEASAVAAVCAYYGMGCTVALMVSDKHPQTPEESSWKWGSDRYAQQLEQYIAACAEFAMEQNGLRDN
ncbi:MAG: nucleoside phosphorylase [Acutalibacter sp.]